MKTITMPYSEFKKIENELKELKKNSGKVYFYRLNNNKGVWLTDVGALKKLKDELNKLEKEYKEEINTISNFNIFEFLIWKKKKTII